MKLRHIVPALGLAALFTLGCTQSTLSASADRETDLATETQPAESTGKSCCPSEAAATAKECTEAQKAECAEQKKECPVSGENSDS